MELTHPHWLILLPAVFIPILRRRPGQTRFSSFLVLPDDRSSRILDWVERILSAIFIGLVVLGLSGPRLTGFSMTQWASGTSLIFVVDQSASMFVPWRGHRRNPLKIDVAHRAIAAFLEAFPHGQWALVGFGRAPVVYTLRTSDPQRFLQTLSLQRGDFGDTVIDTALARALAIADGFQAIVLLSDGAGRMESPEALARRFREVRKRLYWLVIEGSESPEPGMERLMAVLGPWGETVRMKTIRDLHRALKTIGLRETRPMGVTRVQNIDGTRLCYIVALGILLALGIFLKRPFPIPKSDRPSSTRSGFGYGIVRRSL